MISLDLYNIAHDFWYLTDQNGRITAANENFAHFLVLTPEAIKGHCLTELTLSDADTMDAKNLEVMEYKIAYTQVIEVWHVTGTYKNILVNSHKRLICLDNQVLGVLNQSVSIDAEQRYHPPSLYHISNTQLGLKLKDQINALYAFNKQLSQLQKHFSQELALTGMSRIIDKMVVTMEGIIFDNDKYNNATTKTFTGFQYRGLFLVSPANRALLTASQESQRLAFTFLTIDCIDDKILQLIKNGHFSLLLVDTVSLKSLNQNGSVSKYLELNSHITTVMEIVEQLASARLSTYVLPIQRDSTSSIDQRIFPLWQKHLHGIVLENIKKSNAFLILSIEDDVDSQESLQQLLECHMIITVYKAYSGAEALRLAADISFDLIILDINLKDMSGFEVAQQIRAIQYHAQFIFCPIYANTAYDYTDKIDHLRFGIDKIYIKPYIIFELENILREFVPHAISPQGN